MSPNNKGVYEVTCPNGHTFKVDILSHHFHVLFENGLHALVDNYFIESFASFAASYERFIEFFLRIVLISRGINVENFDEAWKNLSKQSERQLGAFMFIYLHEFGAKPSLLSSSLINLRNKVIHKGHLPSEEECLKFGNGVLNFIRNIVSNLKAKTQYEDELFRSVNDSSAVEDFDVHNHNMPYQIFAINRPINETDSKSLEDFYNEHKAAKNRA